MHAPPLPINHIHHVELAVGNAKQASFYYRNTFGFTQEAYAGPETGQRERASYFLRQGNARIILTTPLFKDDPLARHIHEHGDGVVDIAFHVRNADESYTEAVARGGKSAQEPHTVTDKNGSVRRAAIHTYGDVIHSFITPIDYKGIFLPKFEPYELKGRSTGLRAYDHMVGNVEDNHMSKWVDWYNSVLGFDMFLTFDDKDISTDHSALRSTVVASEDRRIKFPINEPADGLKKSQITEYLDYNNGPGVQHIALYTDNIVDTISTMTEQGVDFLQAPDAYYDHLAERVGVIDEDINVLKKLNILVDRDDKGYLLQLFTKPVEDRPTLFYEVIQRKGAEGFGKGNFKALFVAIEQEQRRRGNL
ncbi:4-hydroxyphenylpyruvate dioxygenase [bacterium]|nr:4-hydroxyphenylpyruvate dioxygenase [bacterium]